MLGPRQVGKTTLAQEIAAARGGDAIYLDLERPADGGVWPIRMVDLLFERGGKVEMAIEIKRSTAPDLSAGFCSAREVLKPKEAYIVHGGSGQWPIDKGVTAIDLVGLMRRLS